MQRYLNRFFIIGGVLVVSTMLNADCSVQQREQMLRSGMNVTEVNGICGTNSNATLSNTCKTKYTLCRLKVYGDVGSSCWCVTGNGPKKGILIKK